MSEELPTQVYEPDSELEAKPVEALLSELDGLAHADLKAVHEKAGALLEQQAKEREKAAIQEIQDIARQHGLTVDVKGPRKRRGRPPKAKES